MSLALGTDSCYLMKFGHLSLAAFCFDGSHAQVVPDGVLMVSINAEM